MSVLETEDDKFPYPWRHISMYKEKIPMHFHYHIEIIYVIKGFLRVDVEKSESQINSGELIFINGGISHTTINTGNCCYYLCSIQNFALLPAIQINSKEIVASAVCSDDEEKNLYNLLKCMCINSKRGETVDDIVRQTLLISLANAMMAAIIPKLELNRSHSINEDRLVQVMNYINASYSDPYLSTRSVSERFGYTSHMLSEVFNANFKIGVKKYIDNLRINAAKFQLLSTGNMVEHIAQNVGFDSVRSFYRIFKQITGMTPSEFRN